MSNYYCPIDRQDDWIIYMKMSIPPRIEIEGDILEYYNDLYVCVTKEILKYAFKDNADVIKDIENGVCPSLKLEGEDNCLTVTKFEMNDRNWSIGNC